MGVKIHFTRGDVRFDATGRNFLECSANLVSAFAGYHQGELLPHSQRLFQCLDRLAGRFVVDPKYAMPYTISAGGVELEAVEWDVSTEERYEQILIDQLGIEHLEEDFDIHEVRRISENNEGAWVQVWVFVEDPDSFKLDEEPNEGHVKAVIDFPPLPDPKEVIIEVLGGVVVNVTGAPADYSVKIIDYDNSEG